VRERQYDLRASGSKTVRLEAGTFNDLRVNQSLDLSIGGTIGDGVEVRGVLSDKDMSFGEKAATSKIRDLDRIFMEVQAPSAYVRVGDLEIDEAPGELLKLRRTMTGFYASGSRGSKRLTASGATTKSAYSSTELAGAEGIAGPYLVMGPDGRAAGMVRNSETVYLDGQPMERGRNADYTIDYSSAEIYFNPRHLIRDGARIVVDYECLDHNGRRQFYFGTSSVALGDRATVAVSIANETSSAGTADEDITGLTSGSTPPEGGGWVDGGRLVGLGKGAYVRVDRDTLSYYEFVGDGVGDYDVAFTRVGEAEGTYTYLYSDDWETYVHVYTGRGAYVDKVRQVPSLGARVLHTGASADLTDWLNLKSEVAQSEGHVEDGAGGWTSKRDEAYALEMHAGSQLPSVRGRDIGTVDLRVKRRSIGQSYLGFDRLRRPDFLEKWAQVPDDGSEESNEMEMAYGLHDRVRSTLEIGSLVTGSGESNRHLVGLDVGDERLGLSASSEVARMVSGSVTKGVERNNIGLRVPLKFVHIGAGRHYELKSRLTDSTSLRREEYHTAVKLSGSRGSVSLGLSNGSEDRDTGTGWQQYSSSVEGRLSFETTRGRAASLRGGITQRRVDYSVSASQSDRRITCGDLHLDVRDVLAISSFSVDYRLSNTLTKLYEAELVRVEGVGDYDSLGNYVPGAGEYAVSRREKGNEPVTRVTADFVIAVGRKGRVLLDRSLSSRTGLEIEGESSTHDVKRIALLRPGYMLNDPEMMFGRMNMTQEFVYRRSKRLTVSVNARGSRMLDNRCLGRAEKKSMLELQTKILSNRAGGMVIGLEGRAGVNRSSVEMTSGATRPSRDTWSARLSLQRNITSKIRGQVRMELLNEDRTDPTSSFMQADLSPGFTAFAGALRCDAGCSIKRILRSDYPVSVLLPRRDSFNWHSRLNMRYGRYTSASFEYTGRKATGIPTIHNLRASLSATF
jgi:hypothetical protein